MKNFTKFWTTPYSVPNLCMFGRQYTKTCEELLGVGFSETYFTYSKGIATVYRKEVENDHFSKILAEKFKNNPDIAGKILKEVLIIQSDLLTLFNESDIFTAEFFKGFVKKYDQFLPYFIGVAWAADAIDKNSQQELFNQLQKGRKELEHFYVNSEVFLNKYFKKIQEKMSVNNQKVLSAISETELLDFLERGSLPDLALLEERYDFCVVKSFGGTSTVITGEEAQSLNKTLSNIIITSTKIIKGVVAQKGTATGTVKIVLSLDDIDKVLDGDVLVSAMTRPEWIVAIQKASAIITDVGGTLSHAAIVAREMKKPCIIGTKIATQVLKDGDSVEVDANSGVIKILKPIS